jgi:hypothetical protein
MLHGSGIVVDHPPVEPGWYRRARSAGSPVIELFIADWSVPAVGRQIRHCSAAYDPSTLLIIKRIRIESGGPSTIE